MLRGYRRIIIATLGVVVFIIVVSTGVAYALWPPASFLPDYGWQETAHSNYQPDAGSCHPARIKILRTDAERLRKRESCEDAAEQHRLQTNDLIQQTRAANAATQSFYISEWQSRATVLGLIVGLFTLAAAAAAAVFAKRAADETKRSADALRPHIYLSALESNLGRYLAGADTQVLWKFRITNAGGGPARLKMCVIGLTTIKPGGNFGSQLPNGIQASAFAAGSGEDFSIDLTTMVTNMGEEWLFLAARNRLVLAISTYTVYADAAGADHASSESWRIFTSAGSGDQLKPESDGIGPNTYT